MNSEWRKMGYFNGTNTPNSKSSIIYDIDYKAHRICSILNWGYWNRCNVLFHIKPIHRICCFSFCHWNFLYETFKRHPFIRMNVLSFAWTFTNDLDISHTIYSIVKFLVPQSSLGGVLKTVKQSSLSLYHFIPLRIWRNRIVYSMKVKCILRNDLWFNCTISAPGNIFTVIVSFFINATMQALKLDLCETVCVCTCGCVQKNNAMGRFDRRNGEDSHIELVCKSLHFVSFWNSLQLIDRCRPINYPLPFRLREVFFLTFLLINTLVLSVLCHFFLLIPPYIELIQHKIYKTTVLSLIRTIHSLSNNKQKNEQKTSNANRLAVIEPHS